jgi:uncharacterized protein (TIGR02444 family)
MTDTDTKPTDTKSAEQGSPFWRFSLRFYRVPGVADACIALQEQASVDVNLLLFLLWHAAQKRALTAAELDGLEAVIAPWREAAVVPLRQLRRALKTPPELLPAAAAEAFRNRIKAVELEAERLQQEAMYARVQPLLLGREVLSATDAARANVAAYEALRATRFPPDAVGTLIAAFDTMA